MRDVNVRRIKFIGSEGDRVMENKIESVCFFVANAKGDVSVRISWRSQVTRTYAATHKSPSIVQRYRFGRQENPSERTGRVVGGRY